MENKKSPSMVMKWQQKALDARITSFSLSYFFQPHFLTTQFALITRGRRAALPCAFAASAFTVWSGKPGALQCILIKSMPIQIYKTRGASDEISCGMHRCSVCLLDKGLHTIPRFLLSLSLSDCATQS